METFKLVHLCFFLFSTSCQASSWYTKDQSGWLWYKQAPKKSLLKPQLKKGEDSSRIKDKTLSYREQAKKIQENLEEIQAKAVLNPTLENVRAFQQAQTTVLGQADIFQKMLILAAMMENTGALSSPLSRQIHQQQTDISLDQDIRSLSQHYGLFFLIKKDCPYCHQFAPIVKGLVREYPFDIKAISKDGEALDEFPDAVADNGTIAKLNPEGIYPFLLLVNPATREVIPVARGLVNKEQLKENFRAVIHFLKNHQSRGKK